MMTTVTVSSIQFTIPDHVPGGPPAGDGCSPGGPPGGGCGCGCGCASCNNIPPNPCPPAQGGHPIRYGTGEVVLRATDLSSGGFGVHWGHTRSFASRLSQSGNPGNGYNWLVAEWPYLIFPASGTVAVMSQATGTLWFDLTGNAYVPRYNSRLTLLLDLANNVYRLIDLDGTTTLFNAATGVFQSQTDAAGNSVAVVSYTPNGFNFAEVQRTYSSGGITTLESFLYTYVDPTATYPILSNVLLRRRVLGSSSSSSGSSSSSSSPWTNVLQALYTYYGLGEPYGGQDDLKTVQTQSWNGSAWVNTAPATGLPSKIWSS